jgi:cytidylate kinase
VESHVVIAIDGPAASGKSSVARALAQRLAYLYVNTGAMYRAVNWHVVQSGVDPRDSEQVARSFRSHADPLRNAERPNQPSASMVSILHRNLLSDSVTANVSTIASIPEVRRQLVTFQARLRSGARRLSWKAGISVPLSSRKPLTSFTSTRPLKFAHNAANARGLHVRNRLARLAG